MQVCNNIFVGEIYYYYYIIIIIIITITVTQVS